MVCASGCGLVAASELSAARDRQDLAALDGLIARYQKAAQAPDGQYKLALANSYAAEVALELRDKKKAEGYAQAGIDPAQKAVAANAGNAEYHRLLGEICGQVIPANPIFGALKYGQCARNEITKALQMDNKLALAYVSRGVGNYYLPASMGGGVDEALKDFDKAISLDANLSEAYLWKGVALRKANRNQEARQALRTRGAIESGAPLDQAAVGKDTGTVNAPPAVVMPGVGGHRLARIEIFPGHTYLHSATQIYLPMLERMDSPGYLSRDLVATNPNVSYTIYDEVTLFLHRRGSSRVSKSARRLSNSFSGSPV